MPSWKKVITSGSAAALSSLNVTGGITGSSVLISGSTGTLFSSNVDTLVLTGSLLVTGSTVLSGSLSVTQGITGSLFGTSSWAVSASWAPVATTAATASFVTASNVYGPFGSNSIISASFAVSSSRAVTSSFALTSSYSLNPTVSGAINNVDYIDFSTNYIIGTNAPAQKEGRLFYDSGSGALAMYNWEQDVTLNIGQESWLRARNQTGVTITNGSVVKLVSAIGDRPTIALAQAVDQTNTFNLDNDIIGVATHDIEHGTDGFVTTFGTVNGVNTSAYTAGDILWVSQSAGQYTNVAPPPPFDKTFVGIVTKANPSTGAIFVTPLTSIHFHDISSVSASAYQQGDLWMYRSGSAGLTNAWINTKQLSGSYGLTGSLNASSFVGPLTGNASTATTASNALTASFAPNYLPLTGGTITGSLTITSNLTVLGSASIQYISESTLNIGTNLITVNTLAPSIRFGGLAVIDSGSSPQVSASILYDSVQDEFIFVHKGTASSATTSSVFLLGPETYNNLGNETYLTANRIPKGTGIEHLNDSNISDNGSVVSINSNTQVTGSLLVTAGITGSLFGTSSWAQNAVTASFLGSTTNAFLQNGNSFGTTALLGTNDNQSLALETSGSTRMFISSSGNVGINTTSPDTALHISGDSNTTIKISTTGSSGGDQDIRFNRLGAETWTLGRDNTLNDFRLSYAANNVGGLGSGDLITVKSNGNVGIGTTTPAARLDVSGSLNISGSGVQIPLQVSSGTTPLLFVSQSGKVGIGTTTFVGSIKLAVNGQIGGPTFSSTYLDLTGGTPELRGNSGTGFYAASGDHVFYGASSAERVRITNAGNVGINTTSPLYSLDVVGNIRAYTTLIRRDTSAGSAFINYNESASGYWSVGMSASSYSYDVIDANYGINKLSITNGSTWGVGIGTTAPGAKLDVRGSTYVRNDNTTNQLTIDNDSVGTNASPQYSDILFGGYSTALRARIRGVDRASNTTIGGLILQSSTDGTTLVDRLFLNGNGESYFYNNSSEVMRIDSTGNVGIGKTTPNARLDVSGSAIISGSFTVTPGTVREFQVRTTGVDIGNLITDTHTVTGSLSVSGSITGSLFGTASFASTASFLNSTTNAFIQNGNSFGATALLGTNDNQSLALETNGTTRMFISSSGNVGIGTNTPSASLDVVGGNIVINYQSNYGSRNSINNIVPLIEVGVGSMSGASQSNLYKAGYSNTNGFEIGTAAAVGIYGIDNDGTNVRTFGILTNNVRRLTIDSTGSLRVNGNTTITGSLTVSQSLLQYSNVTAVTSGSTSNVASFNTSSYTAAFFDYVTTSGTSARAGSVFTVWNGNSVEYTETSTNDIGSTSNLILSASVSAGAVRLQATSLSGSWAVKTLARML